MLKRQDLAHLYHKCAAQRTSVRNALFFYPANYAHQLSRPRELVCAKVHLRRYFVEKVQLDKLFPGLQLAKRDFFLDGRAADRLLDRGVLCMVFVYASGAWLIGMSLSKMELIRRGNGRDLAQREGGRKQLPQQLIANFGFRLFNAGFFNEILRQRVEGMAKKHDGGMQ
jgi:hypothetical protein